MLYTVYVHAVCRFSSDYVLHTGFFYFTLGNLEPKYRSTIASIQLLGIVKKSLLDKYGIDAVLQPFVDDLKKLVIVKLYCILHTCY